ncbi:hypothetical protein DL766_008049 [Monosporascus sp. MC13-8B]|uniref:Ankyrin repeat protein n=1 Tax=Monosporascus cannonballus TaxID=155416 RepID=A0ABY0GZ03_9PEZI|nr:hypothetical protein DL762_007492 [Monosporascus cannonballus]RYO82745.1 hypothetical protein DL763_008134 [Monosporascus cannonballus]RYP20996.1 hypothetical protein DL766_008049 [Monosporascus sp. MC13-8B]
MDDDVRRYIEARIEKERLLAKHVRSSPALMEQMTKTVVEGSQECHTADPEPRMRGQAALAHKMLYWIHVLSGHFTVAELRHSFAVDDDRDEDGLYETELMITAGAKVSEAIYRQTPLHTAAQEGRESVAQVLIDAGADCDDRSTSQESFPGPDDDKVSDDDDNEEEEFGGVPLNQAAE